MSESIDSKCICVPESFLKLLLQYFAEGVGEGEPLAETLFKNLSEHEIQSLLAEDVDQLVEFALQSGNVSMARMIGRFLRTEAEGPHGGLTFKEKALSVARRRR